MQRFALTATVLLLTAAAARADQAGVKLQAEKPVYKAGVAGDVKFTLTNNTADTITLSTPTPWSISKDDKLVYAPFSIMILGSVAPGQSKTWTWNKKGYGDEWVGAGTYTIKVGLIWAGGDPFSLTCDVALTPNGKLAGTSRFPLAVGNEWTYVSEMSQQETMKVAYKWGDWYWVKKLVGGSRWAHMSSSWQPTLIVTTASDSTSPLFRFNRPVGYTYKVNVGFIKKMKVGGTDETVNTPAGTFTGCYRLDVAENGAMDAGYGSFWFAPGVGLVQYTTIWIGGQHTYRLHHAKIKGSDGKTYGFGQN
ncbi:MAG: hypothetical protein HYY17_09950 [Planctomycetes bacterium]|nr:hypothetical protein [Planctomycetota bacterium]